MEGQSLSAFFALSGTAVGLLFLVVLWQRLELEKAKANLDRASKVVARKTGTTPGTILPLIEEAPYPICFAGPDGSILKASKSFYTLCGSKIATLNEFTKATGAELRSTSKKTRHERIVIRTSASNTLRHFSLVAWPVISGGETTGTMYTLLEHTKSVQHSNDHYTFNREVLSLQSELIGSLDSSKNPALVKEIEELNEFLRETYTSRSHRSLEYFDLASVVENALTEYRPLFRARNVAITSTLPKQLKTHGLSVETAEVVRLLLAGAAEHAPAHSTVRLHVAKRGSKSLLSVSLPDYRRAHETLDEAFAFGSKSDKRASRVRFALARLLMGHQKGSLHLTVDEENQVIAELLFA